jgi:hypothetical protein
VRPVEVNVLAKGREDIAVASRKRAIDLGAIEFGSHGVVERECLEAVFAYEECLRVKNGRRPIAIEYCQVLRRRWRLAGRMQREPEGATHHCFAAGPAGRRVRVDVSSRCMPTYANLVSRFSGPAFPGRIQLDGFSICARRRVPR